MCRCVQDGKPSRSIEGGPLVSRSLVTPQGGPWSLPSLLPPFRARRGPMAMLARFVSTSQSVHQIPCHRAVCHSGSRVALPGTEALLHLGFRTVNLELTSSRNLVPVPMVVQPPPPFTPEYTPRYLIFPPIQTTRSRINKGSLRLCFRFGAENPRDVMGEQTPLECFLYPAIRRQESPPRFVS